MMSHLTFVQLSLHWKRLAELYQKELRTRQTLHSVTFLMSSLFVNFKIILSLIEDTCRGDCRHYLALLKKSGRIAFKDRHSDKTPLC